MACRYFNAKYMMIAENIIRRLRAGEFLNGGPFYSRDELAREYHVSPGTARAVMHELEDRGVIACRKGKRSVPACFAGEDASPAEGRPVFFRDSYTAETREYDYLTYCVRNLLMRRKMEYLERDIDAADDSPFPELSAGDVGVVVPSAASDFGKEPEHSFRPTGGATIHLLVNQAGSDAVSVFTKKAGFDCILHLVRHNTAGVVRVATRYSIFPWYKRLVSEALNEYTSECAARTVFFDGELEMFPDFLSEVIPACAIPDSRPVAVLIDDPYLSDFLSGEIRTGSYRPPSRCSFFGTAFNERSIVFPYLDLRLDELAATILQTVCAKAENPSASQACEFHLIKFRVPRRTSPPQI